MGGEKTETNVILICKEGSPPHGRGKVCYNRVARKEVRDHPRMGGEKKLVNSALKLFLGSPPHGRGKADRKGDAGFHGGITPAWAGKRQEVVELGQGDKDHPRMGGEKHHQRGQQNILFGSPPHGRGKGAFLSL